VNALLKPELVQSTSIKPAARPRIGFLGVGWIGRHRLQALAESGVAQIAAIADTQIAARSAAAECAPDAALCDGLEQLAEQDLDGVVIATPSGAHAAQAIGALKRGLAVFCQKPLSRTASEAAQVISTARSSDRLIAVDFSYRCVSGMSTLRQLLQCGELGDVYAVDLTFHNAYGPDKDWFYKVDESGGGCVMDLGTHLIDLALWATGCDVVEALDAQLYARGRRLQPPLDTVEDYAAVQWRLGTGTHVRMACSWRLAAGCDAHIEAAFYGTRGGVALRNVDGSFYDFTIERFDGTRRTRIAQPPDAWGGRALVGWAQRIAAGERFDPACSELIAVASVVDRIYGR
jgi:predicted dehydrogenase